MIMFNEANWKIQEFREQIQGNVSAITQFHWEQLNIWRATVWERSHCLDSSHLKCHQLLRTPGSPQPDSQQLASKLREEMGRSACACAFLLSFTSTPNKKPRWHQNTTLIFLHFLVSRVQLSKFSGTVCSHWKRRCQNILAIITQKILIEHKGVRQSLRLFAADRSDAQTTQTTEV